MVYGDDAGDEPGEEDSESDASSFPMSEEEDKKATAKQAEPKKGQRGRKRRTEPIVVTKEDGTREEVSPQVYRRLRRWNSSMAQMCVVWQQGKIESEETACPVTRVTESSIPASPCASCSSCLIPPRLLAG